MKAAWSHARYAYYREQHHERYEKYVKEHGLLCQECGGAGEYADDWIDHCPIMLFCGWCEGTGLVTRWLRGEWLKYKRIDKLAKMTKTSVTA